MPQFERQKTMVVNSISFWGFFILLLVPYWLASKYSSSKWQNWLLLIASYYFYAQVNWKMCGLLFLATVVFYTLGLLVERYNTEYERAASALTSLGVGMGVGLLVYFKFLDFFIDEFANLLNTLGLHTNMSSFGIIMPLGISFFTFKLISYVVEIHRENIPASRDFVDFCVYVAFFPTIMSGPIDRPNQFLPQLRSVRRFSYDDVCEGLKRILWGMFLKMCIADRLSGYTDAVLDNYTQHNATSVLFAALLYSFQMYTDFCGYSDMAIGVGQIMGIRIRENFSRPFWAQNIAEYWRRWHMSLTTWLTDYVFMPLNLAFRDWGKWGLYLATLLNLIIVGFWHGANLTFGLFGLYHALLLICVIAFEKRRKRLEKKYSLKDSPWWRYGRQLLTFILCTVGFLLFRSASCTDFYRTIGTLVSGGYGLPLLTGYIWHLAFAGLSIGILIIREYKQERHLTWGLLHSPHYWVRIASVSALALYVLFCGEAENEQFIYFRF